MAGALLMQLQDLIDAAPAYSTLDLPEVDHWIDQTVVVRKPLRISGSGRIRETGVLRPMLRVEAPEVDLDCLRFVGSETLETWNKSDNGPEFVDRAAIQILADDCNVSGCRVIGKSVAVRVVGNRAAIHGNNFCGLFNEAPKGWSNWHQLISLAGDRHNVSGNLLRQCGGGITAGDILTHSVLSNNTIEDTHDNGIYLSSGAHCVINGNTIRNAHSGGGIKARGWLNTINGNTLDQVALVGIAVTAIAGQGGYGNAVIANTIQGCGAYGITLDLNNGEKVQRCIVSDNILESVAQLSTARTRYAAIRIIGERHRLDGNIVNGCHDESLAMIHVHESPSSRITDNQGTDVRHGIYGRASEGLYLRGNQITARSKGIDLRECPRVRLGGGNQIDGEWWLTQPEGAGD